MPSDLSVYRPRLRLWPWAWPWPSGLIQSIHRVMTGTLKYGLTSIQAGWSGQTVVVKDLTRTGSRPNDLYIKPEYLCLLPFWGPIILAMSSPIILINNFYLSWLDAALNGPSAPYTPNSSVKLQRSRFSARASALNIILCSDNFFNKHAL